MSERGWIEPIVERVVRETIDTHAAQLRSEIIRRVTEEVAAHPAPAAQPASNAGDLARAVAEIHAGSSQKEILRALLDVSARYASRAALFVVKGSKASGWQARGFSHTDGFKDYALDAACPAVVHAITERTACEAGSDQFDQKFLEQFQAPGGDARLFPLILKDKVAALVYADAGTSGEAFDSGALEVLVSTASAWLEVNALRKQAQKEPATPAPQSHNNAEAVASPPFNDPFAAHAPAFSKAAAAGADGHSSSTEVQSSSTAEIMGTAQNAATEVQSAATMAPAAAVSDPIPAAPMHVESSATETPAAGAVSSEDQEVHRKAQRFARLLVDEIKLYNQAKVSEGRKKKDLYDRLKDAIEKSRATYQKRYGNTVAASGNYFQHEVVRSLAEDDATVLGPNFRL